MRRKDFFLMAGFFLSTVFGVFVGRFGVQKLAFAESSQKAKPRQDGTLHKGEKGAKTWKEPPNDYIDGNLVELGTLGAADDGKVIKWDNTADKLVIGDAGGVPAGVIVMWSGTYNNIPTGWALCDGTAPTPDLRDRFIYGVNTAYAPGDDGDIKTTGGSTSHFHTQAAHSHNIGNGAVLFGPNSGGAEEGRLLWGYGDHFTTTLIFGRSIGNDFNVDLTGNFNYNDTDQYLQLQDDLTSSVAPTINSSSSLPPYFKLAYIMKL